MTNLRVGNHNPFGARALPKKQIRARVTKGDGKAQTQGGHGGKGAASGSALTKGNRNKGRTKVNRGSGGAQSQRGRSRRTNGDIARDAARDLAWSLHPQRGSTLG